MKMIWVGAGFMFIVTLFSLFSIIKFATEVKKEHKMVSEENLVHDRLVLKTSHLALRTTANLDYNTSLSYPYIAAILTQNGPNEEWRFVCFGCVVLDRWILTAAHCHTQGYSYRTFLYYDYVNNRTQTYLIKKWIIHPGYTQNGSLALKDIALAAVDVVLDPKVEAVSMSKRIDQTRASVWKTVMTMDRQLYLTNELVIHDAELTDPLRCYEQYGVNLDTSFLCVDMPQNGDCYVNDFGPLFTPSQRVVGILNKPPKDCAVTLAIFTNVPTYSDWILKSTGGRI